MPIPYMPIPMPYPPKPPGDRVWDLRTWHIFIDVLRDPTIKRKTYEPIRARMAQLGVTAPPPHAVNSQRDSFQKLK